MKKEAQLLNLICIIAAIGFLVFAVINALTSGQVISTDNLFVTMVCLVMALLFAVNPFLYLKSEGKLPVPFLKKSSPQTSLTASSPARLPAKPATPLLDAKGRTIPPDVRAIVSKFPAEPKDA